MFISLKNVIYELEILFLISSDMLRIGIGSISYMYIFNNLSFSFDKIYSSFISIISYTLSISPNLLKFRIKPPPF